MDRLQAMRIFVAVINEGSFTQAAERLVVSPQLVSKYVGQLEDYLGVRLLNRTTRRLHLTEAGSAYFQRAQQLLADIDDMEQQLGRMHTQARGTLRISAPVSFAIRHMAPLINDFQKTHPGVTVDLQLNDRKVDIIDEGFDVALRIGRLQPSSLVAKRLAPVRLVYCAAPTYLAEHGEPTSLKQLNQHRYLHYSYMDESVNPSANRKLESNNGDVLVDAARAGAGIVLQPTFITGSAIRAGDLKVVLSSFSPEPIALYAVFAHRQLMASKVRSFIDFVDGYFGDPPYWDSF